MANVLIDLRMVRGRLHGIARYALELACRLPELAPDLRFAGLTGPEGLPTNLGTLTPRLPLHRCPVGFLSPLEQPALAASLVRLDPDLFHATSFSVPALWPGRLVATLHDANHLVLAEEYGTSRRVYYRLIVGPRAKRAQALITVSEFSRDELARELGLSPYRLQVIPNGVDARYQPQMASELKAFRERHQLPPRFLLAVGNTKPFKNLGMLADVAEELPEPLVLLAGERAAWELGFPDGTRELSNMPEEDMPRLYGAATALLLPSRYEGFGLPALEAMACGTPVVAARATSLPEVVGEAALLLPPDDASAWKDAAQRLVRDDALRRSLGEKGRERAGLFTWDDCARRTLATYRRALEAR
ncbi:glycosyl transferase family 1 [Melittangium boletus DSM 14713]|uniref:Glycosyl transferase family 1 n=2 Tax=Melittangium boletus TaxID=83453 RepID=A0A286NUZ1_9BACT|nr:glycosyl transferase family 1 [Melittangium boletus DSM 14713]